MTDWLVKKIAKDQVELDSKLFDMQLKLINLPKNEAIQKLESKLSSMEYKIMSLEISRFGSWVIIAIQGFFIMLLLSKPH